MPKCDRDGRGTTARGQWVVLHAELFPLDLPPAPCTTATSPWSVYCDKLSQIINRYILWQCGVIIIFSFAMQRIVLDTMIDLLKFC